MFFVKGVRDAFVQDPVEVEVTRLVAILERGLPKEKTLRCFQPGVRLQIGNSALCGDHAVKTRLKVIGHQGDVVRVRRRVGFVKHPHAGFA